MRFTKRRSPKLRSVKSRNIGHFFKPRFESLEPRQLLSGTPLPFDDSGLAPAGLQALCALPNLPVFNVLNYGAKGNGVTDDTLAIRSALSAAEAGGGGIIYLPTGTYAVDTQASDPKAWGPIFSITSSNIVFIGDGASHTHLVAYVQGLKDPATNWFVTGDSYQKIGRGNMFEVDPSANVTGIQFRSLDINGQAGYTGNFTVGGNTTTGDGWDTYDKAICLGFGIHRVDNTLIFNCNVRNWRGEEVYAGGNTNGAISIINCSLTGSNADAISCSAAVLMSHSTIGGTTAGDDVYNGLEDYCFPTQSTTVDHSTIICSSNPAAPHGYGLSFEGEAGGSTLTVTNSVFANNTADILLQDTAHNVLIDGNTFTNSVLGGVITSILNLYPGITSGFSDVTISNNTYQGNWQGASLFAPGNYGTAPSRNFPNLVISGNTVTKGQLLGGAFGGTLGAWTGFVVENNTLEPGTRDIDPGIQGSNIGLWSGTVRPTFGTSSFYGSGVLNYGGSGPTATVKILSDTTVLAANSAGSNPLAAEINPAALAGFPIGFTTTVYSYNANNWTLKADPSWNTFASDIPVTAVGVMIRVNSQGLFEVVASDPSLPASTSTTVTSSGGSAIFGQSVTFTATVSATAPDSGTPTGTVTFLDGSTTLGTATLNASGSATFSTAALAVGNHTISVSYGGVTNFAGSTSGNLTQAVVHANTSTTVSSSAGSSVFGQSVTFTATVSATAPGSGTPTGTVTFLDGSTTLGTATLNASGSATFSTAALAVGNHTISVSYGGVTNFAGSTSGNLTQAVVHANTSTTVSSSAGLSVFGQSVTFTATVSATTPGSGTPTGTVTFLDGSTTLGTATLNASGSATFSTAALAVGNHTISASYGGVTSFAGSTSSNLTQAVAQTSISTSTTVSSSAGSSVFGQSVTFTATVSATALGSGTPTGTVTFLDGSTTLGTATLNASGTATLSTAALAVGNHTITVSYGGDGNFTASVGNTTQMVNSAPSSTAATSSASPSTVGQTVTFTATVGDGLSVMPTGNVTFFDGATTIGTSTLDSNGKATLSTAALSAGSHTIKASYGGCASFSTSSAQFMQMVGQPAKSTVTALKASANPSVFGQLVTFTATVKAGASLVTTGTVTFLDGSVVLGAGTLNSKGVAAFSTSTLIVGAHTITATYNGTTSFATSTGQLTESVNRASTGATIISSAITSAFGQLVTFTATVTTKTPGKGIPTGTVTFLDGNTALGYCALNANGKATFSTAALGAGSHAITAYYGGSDSSGTSSAKLSQAVKKATTITTISSSASLSAFGQLVTFTATVTAKSPSLAIPIGTVTFLDGTKVIGTGTLDATGRATFTIASLAVGSHAITASYVATPIFTASSTKMTQTVALATVAAAVSSSSNDSFFGQTVTFTANITAIAAGSLVPTGSVVFFDGNNVLGTSTLDSTGAATFTTAALGAGNHVITVSYTTTGKNYKTTSATMTQTVNQAITSATLTSSATASILGQPITFTASVIAVASGAGVPNGKVTFFDGSTVLATVLLDATGQAIFTTSALDVGDHVITASYAGVPNFAVSSDLLPQSIIAPA